MSKSAITCRVCSSQNQHECLLAKDVNQAKSDTSFFYYCCNDCRSVFLDPVPDNLGFYYGQDYPAYAVKNSKSVEKKLNFLEREKLKIVKRHVSSGRLVEVGPAAGRFLSVASRAGYDVLGIEQDVGCFEHIKNVLCLGVKQSDKPADELALLTDSCDVIVAWHVIEHLQDLRGFVSSAAKALRQPYGVIIISAPNPEALSLKLFGYCWVHLDAPRHLTLIPLFALDRLMAAHGLERVGCVFDDAVGLLLNKTGWQGSLANFSRQKKICPRLLTRLLGRMLAILMAFFDRIHRNGAAYTATYKHRTSLIVGKKEK